MSFSCWFGQNKYDYVDFKQHFCPQCHVAATDMKALGKKQMTLQAVAYLGFPAPGDKLSLLRHSQPARPWEHKIKETLESDALLATI